MRMPKVNFFEDIHKVREALRRCQYGRRSTDLVGDLGMPMYRVRLAIRHLIKTEEARCIIITNKARTAYSRFYALKKDNGRGRYG